MNSRRDGFSPSKHTADEQGSPLRSLSPDGGGGRGMLTAPTTVIPLL